VFPWEWTLMSSTRPVVPYRKLNFLLPLVPESRSPPRIHLITAYQPTFRRVFLSSRSFEAAFENDPEAALVLATTFHPLSQLENDLSDNSNECACLFMKGRFSRADCRHIPSSNAYVSSSLGEGWNLPLCEAAACGLPVIAPQHSAHAELLSHDIAYLYPLTVTHQSRAPKGYPLV